MSGRLPPATGCLLDIDGTLLIDDAAVPGAAAALQRLRGSRRPFRLITNTTRRSRAATARILRDAGFDIEAATILTPAVLARRRILASGRTRTTFLLPQEAIADLTGVQAVNERADWVVVGDCGAGFTWERLNLAFRLLRAGASLLALQKNRFWHDGERGCVLDAGPFVHALEYATGVEAEVLGKPSSAFFRLALEDLGLPAGEVLMVGDDPEADVGGGRGAGCLTVLVRTGRYRDGDDLPAGLRPDAVVDSVADLF